MPYFTTFNCSLIKNSICFSFCPIFLFAFVFIPFLKSKVWSKTVWTLFHIFRCMCERQLIIKCLYFSHNWHHFKGFLCLLQDRKSWELVYKFTSRMTICGWEEDLLKTCGVIFRTINILKHYRNKSLMKVSCLYQNNNTRHQRSEGRFELKWGNLMFILEYSV